MTTKQTKLKAALGELMKIDTWNSGHPLDQRRFHKALKRAFDEVGFGVGAADFRAAMMDLARERKPRWPDKTIEEEIERFVVRADQIASYFNDIGAS